MMIVFQSVTLIPHYRREYLMREYHHPKYRAQLKACTTESLVLTNDTDLIQPKYVSCDSNRPYPVISLINQCASWIILTNLMIALGLKKRDNQQFGRKLSVSELVNTISIKSLQYRKLCWANWLRSKQLYLQKLVAWNDSLKLFCFQRFRYNFYSNRRHYII